MKDRWLVCWGPGHTWNVCTSDPPAYLECSGCSIANHQSPSESKMVLYWRKKSFQSIQPLCHYAQGGCRRGRLWLTWCLIPWNDLRWQEPHIHSCCPQPPTMILSTTCRISSMYSSAESTSNKLASFKSSRQWLCDFQRTILHAVTNWKYPPDQALHWELREEWEKHKLKGSCKTVWMNLQEQPAWNIRKRAIVFGELPKEGRWREKTIPPQCTRSKLRLLQRTCFHQTCLICKHDKSAACTRYTHCQTWNPHHQESGQSIRETCGVFMPLKFTQVGPSSMISYGEVDGSSPSIPEDEEDGTSTLLPICASVWTTPTTRKPSTRYQGCSSNSLQ